MDCEMELIELIAAHSSRIPIEQVDEMKSLANAGECGIAFENFCTQLFEYDCVITREDYERLVRIGRSMGIDDVLWTSLSIG